MFENNIENHVDFLRKFSKYSGITITDLKEIFSLLSSFMGECVDNQISLKTNIFELYYSEMKGRENVDVNNPKKRIYLPPTRKARLSLSYTFRNSQKRQNKFFKHILEEKEKSMREYDELEVY